MRFGITIIVLIIGMIVPIETEAQEKRFITNEKAIFAVSRPIAGKMYSLSDASSVNKIVECFPGFVFIPNSPASVEIIQEKKDIYKVKVLSGPLKSKILYVHSGYVREEEVKQKQNIFATYKMVPATKPNADVYDLHDDNLKGKVKKVVERSERWVIVKKYDILGRLYYFDRGNHHISPEGSLKHTVLSLVFPKHEVYSHIYYSNFSRDQNYLNPLYLLGVNVSTGKDNFDPPYIFIYNEDGLIDKIYSGNTLKYTCEYDETGRFIKRYEDNLPTLSIQYEDRGPCDFPAYKIKRYTTEGASLQDITYSYDSSGKLTPGYYGPWYELYGKEGQILSMTTNKNTIQYEYYADSNKLKELREYEFDSYPKNVLIRQYYYNSNGDLSKYQVFRYYQQSKEIFNKEVYIWKYKYDSYGNWISVTKYKLIQGDIDVEDKIETITREYEYYE